MRDSASAQNIGRSALKLGPLGLGIAPLGNLYASVTDAQAEATLATAQREGVFSWLDVAPLYGFGLAEERLGRFLGHWPSRPVVSTKVGRLLEPVTGREATLEPFVEPLPFHPVFDYSRAGIERSYEESLRRLRLERVELLLLHDIDRVAHPQGHRQVIAQALDEALPALHRLKADGRIDAIGIGVNEWDAAFEVLASSDIDCVLLAGRYTLLDQSALTSGFLDACLRRGVAVLAGGVFNSGFLAGGEHFDYRAADAALAQRREQLDLVCRRHGIELPTAALHFTSTHPAVTSVVVGARSPEEVAALARSSRARVPAELWSELKAAGLIPREAPCTTL